MSPPGAPPGRGQSTATPPPSPRRPRPPPHSARAAGRGTPNPHSGPQRRPGRSATGRRTGQPAAPPATDSGSREHGTRARRHPGGGGAEQPPPAAGHPPPGGGGAGRPGPATPAPGTSPEPPDNSTGQGESRAAADPRAEVQRHGNRVGGGRQQPRRGPSKLAPPRRREVPCRQAPSPSAASPCLRRAHALGPPRPHARPLAASHTTHGKERRRGAPTQHPPGCQRHDPPTGAGLAESAVDKRSTIGGLLLQARLRVNVELDVDAHRLSQPSPDLHSGRTVLQHLGHRGGHRATICGERTGNTTRRWSRRRSGWPILAPSVHLMSVRLMLPSITARASRGAAGPVVAPQRGCRGGVPPSCSSLLGASPIVPVPSRARGVGLRASPSAATGPSVPHIVHAPARGAALVYPS